MVNNSGDQNLYINDAHLYDLDNRDELKRDIPFYIEFAQKINEPILELACGTGRLTIPLAEAGHEVWGVELSTQMLEQFKIKISNLPQEISGKIHLFQEDMSEFSLDRKFPLIIIPGRSFQLLYKEETENSCLKHVLEHLTDDGYFIVSIADFVGGRENVWVNNEEVFDWENVDPKTGFKVRRTHIKKEIDTHKQIIYPQKNYYIMKYDNLIEKIVKRSPWKYFSLTQIRNLLISNGFNIIKEMGSYDEKPIGEGSEFIFISQRK
jgi:SAM-dependent methyltransferase